jgi:poly-gamma-glutamate system protein
MIGVEWSELTTTLGSLEAKRSACDPAWALQFLRWYRAAGLAPGDAVAIYSSASFPGMLLNAWLAAEAAGLQTLVVVSLGASTWGANHPDAPWPVLEVALRRGGFLPGRANFYTLGGSGEVGGGLSAAAIARFRDAAGSAGVEILEARELADMVELKSDLLRAQGAGLLVTIGGPHSSLGDDPEALRFPPGLSRPGGALPAGNGVVARVLDEGTPVVHVLDIRRLSQRAGLPFDAPYGRRAPLHLSPGWALFGLALFFGVVLTHRRWRLV